ncbi:hypothetical protein N2152v2_008571 [Parachlorella kessleri]
MGPVVVITSATRRLYVPPAAAGAAAAAAQAAAAAPAAVAAAAPTSAFGLRTLDGLPLPTFIPTKVKPRREPVPLLDAIKQVQAQARANFDETVELALRLGIDPRRGDQMVRGATMLPHGTGKAVRVCVFAKDEAAEAARAAGADVVGSDSLIQQIQESGGSNLAFDKCIATPDMMPKLGKVARILGPRGLMPNPKLGTVTTNVAEAIGQMKKGRVEFRADKGGVVHAGLGKVSFDSDRLHANIATFAAAIMAARPKGVKGSSAGGYILSATLSSTMGAGVPITLPSLVAAGQSMGKSK